MFREENITDQFVNVKRDLDDLLETLDDINPKNVETFNDIKNWKEKIKVIRNEVIDNITSLLEKE